MVATAKVSGRRGKKIKCRFLRGGCGTYAITTTIWGRSSKADGGNERFVLFRGVFFFFLLCLPKTERPSLGFVRLLLCKNGCGVCACDICIWQKKSLKIKLFSSNLH